MKCQVLFPEKNISKCHLLKNLPRVLIVKGMSTLAGHSGLFLREREKKRHRI